MGRLRTARPDHGAARPDHELLGRITGLLGQITSCSARSRAARVTCEVPFGSLSQLCDTLGGCFRSAVRFTHHPLRAHTLGTRRESLLAEPFRRTGYALTAG